MPRIFISYRRADSTAVTGRIHDRLIAIFDEKNVFKDVDDILPGEDFRKVLEREVSRCDVLLAVIGQQWAAITDEDGHRRLHDPNDFVNIEVEAGLQRDTVLVIPVLVNDASMPDADDLPDNLRSLSYRNAIVVRNDPDFNRDMQRLIQRIQAYEQHLNPAPPHRFLIGAIGAVAALLLIALILNVQSGQIFGTAATGTSTAAPTVTTAPTLTVASTSATWPITQPVAQALDDARVWSLPDVKQGEVITRLDPDTDVIIVSGPVLGPIREDTDAEDGWYQVRRPENATPIGWVWVERLSISDRVITTEMPADAHLDRSLFVTDPWMFGDDVLFVQGRLHALGYDPGPIDGYYGPVTEGAVKNFQQRNDLTVDGVVGNQTWGTLFGTS